MGVHVHQIAKRRIERHFTKGLGAAAQQRMFRDLKRCDACAGVFNRYHRAERALCLDLHDFTPFALDRIETAVLDGPRRALANRTRPMGLLSAVAGTAAALAVGLFILFSQGPAESHRVNLLRDASFVPAEFQARGTAGEQASLFGVRVFIVSKRGDEVREERGLGLTDIITFTYTRAPEGPGYLTLFALQDDDQPLWYYPDYGEVQSTKIKGQTVDEPLGDGIDLSVNHRPGRLQVVALFTDKPLTVKEVAAGIRELSAGGVPRTELPARLIDEHGKYAVGYLIELNIDGPGE